VTAIDRQQVIEDTAKAIHDTLCIFHRDGRTQIGCYGIEQRSETDAMLALPVIVAAVLKPIRELHAPIDAADYSGGPFRGVTQVCIACGTDDGNWQRHPCPTVRLCDEVEAAAKGGE
jgi:hypothetical protein